MTTTTDTNLYTKVEKLIQQSKRGETHKDRVLLMNEARFLLSQELKHDLTTLIANYKGYLSQEAWVDEIEDIYQEVMSDESYEQVGTEEIL